MRQENLPLHSPLVHFSIISQTLGLLHLDAGLFGAFSVAAMNCPDKDDIGRKKGFCWAHSSRIQPFMAGTSGQQELEGAYHNVSIVRKQRKVKVCSCAALPSPGSQSEKGTSHSGMIFLLNYPSQGNPPQTCPEAHLVSLYFVRLTTLSLCYGFTIVRMSLWRIFSTSIKYFFCNIQCLVLNCTLSDINMSSYSQN